MLYCTRFFHNLPFTFEEGDFCWVCLRGKKGYVWLFGEHMWWLSVWVCVCVSVSVSVFVCVCREAVRTRAFLSSDGRIALLRPRRTDSVWESWKETTVCFLREMGLLQYTTQCCLSFAAFLCLLRLHEQGTVSCLLREHFVGHLWSVCPTGFSFWRRVSIPPFQTLKLRM